MSTPPPAPVSGASPVDASGIDIRYWVPDRKLPEIIENLWNYGLIRYDPTCQLPLKGSGLTDVYFELRLARAHPKAVKYITSVFTTGIESCELEFDQFMEIPHAISPIATGLSLRFDKPMLTIRDQKKANHDMHIGAFKAGDEVLIVDDVMTTSGSKRTALEFAAENGLVTKGILILVDRDDGSWRDEFTHAGITVPVFAGFPLSKVRSLIQELAGAA
jgi:orotate phosphoribosyltransferase